MQIDRKQALQILGYISELEAYGLLEPDDVVLRRQILAAFPDLG